MSRDFHDEDQYNENENIKSNTEENSNGTAENNYDDFESQEKAEKMLQENRKGVSPQEESSCEEGNCHNEKETETCSEEGNPYEAFRNKTQISNEEKSTKDRRHWGTAVIALAVALAIALATLLPTLLLNAGMLALSGVRGIGNILGAMIDAEIAEGNGEQEIDSTQLPDGNVGIDEDMNVIKNDGSINVNEQVGSTGFGGDLSVAEVVEQVADTVVEITTTNVVTDRFYGQYVTSGAGSGVIISENGYIITNHHVIDGARRITVRLTDGSEFSATLIGSNADKDIALLKISATGLRAAVLGSSEALVVGQEVVAIGNPLGSLGGTVTDGIISALDRTVVIDGHRMTLMQTNAAINPGNSGGGLFNRAGELIGIVNAKQADTGIEGLGFAIPIDVAWETVESIAGGR